jgi:hypothetical protein
MSLLSCPYVEIDNEDDSYYVFVKCLMLDECVAAELALRCRRVIPPISVGSKLKKHSIEFEPHEGTYPAKYKEHALEVAF